MKGKNFFELDNEDEVNSTGKILMAEHAQWKNYEMKAVKQYYILFDGVKKYLPLMGKAAPLYMYYCVVSKNKTGESWYAVGTIADYLNVSTRTINIWNEVLINLGLIKRVNNKTRTTHTYLLPTNDYVSNQYDGRSKDLDKYLSVFLDKVAQSNEALSTNSSEKIRFIHIFQWRKSGDAYTLPYNVLIACVTRYGYQGSSRKTTRYSFYTLRLLEKDSRFVKLSAEASAFKDGKFKQFDSPFSDNEDFIGKSKISSAMDLENTFGLAVPTKYDLQRMIEGAEDPALIQILTQFMENEDELKGKLEKVSLIPLKGGDGNYESTEKD